MDNTLKLYRSLLVILLLFAGHVVAHAVTAPYSPSTVIKKIDYSWASHRHFATGSDNFHCTWADDNHLYAPWGDGGGFGTRDGIGVSPIKAGTNSSYRVGLGIVRIEGSGDNYVGYNRWGHSGNSEHTRDFSGKSWGILSVDGVLYMWVGPDGNNALDGWGDWSWHVKWQRLYKSTDHGAHWVDTGVEFNVSEDLCVPGILNFGKDYSGSRDNYVYHYFSKPTITDDFNGCPVLPEGTIYLARVLKNKMEQKSAYQFFAGRNGTSPIWTSSVSAKQPVFQDPNGSGWTVSVSYNAGLNRYLLMTSHGSGSSAFQMRGAQGNLGVFDAPEPWGPWTTVSYMTGDEGTGFGKGHIAATTFFWNLPSKWQSSDGRDATMVFTGTEENDCFNSIEIHFDLGSSPESAGRK